MKATALKVLLLICIFIIGMIIGVFNGVPFIEKRGWWSIGVVVGENPFTLVSLDKPALTIKDINDLDAKTIADPFIITKNDSFFMFFEVMNRKTNQGDIGFATSVNGLNWKYGGIVLDELWHLSYPQIIKHDGYYYLIPESNRNATVTLYRSTVFPKEWECLGNLIEGVNFVDPTVVFYNNTWFMFATTLTNDYLNLYYSQYLEGPWEKHPQSPIAKRDKLVSRSAGRIITIDNKLYRYSQDCRELYGEAIYMFEITDLTRENYSQQLVQTKPIILPNRKWDSERMHHIDLIQLDSGEWLGLVDYYKHGYLFGLSL